MTAIPATEIEELDSKTKEEVRESLAKWKDKEGNLIMILHEIQNRYGYVPREVALFLTREMGVKMARIYEVVTFYNYFKLVPPGKHDVIVCNGTACYLKGAAQILQELEARLGIKDGDTTRDQIFHLETVRCIGCCGMAPAMVVDGKTIGRAKPSDMKGIVDSIRAEEETEKN